jgi:signal transduction histidine kinase
MDPASETGARRRHDEVLADIARFAGSSLDLSEVLERIVERAAALTGADRSSIWLLDRSDQRLLPSALFGMDPAFTAGWKQRPLDLTAERLSQEVIATGRPVVVHDPASDPRTDKTSVAFFGDQSLLVAPLERRGRVLGTLFINHVRDRYHFTDGDVATVVAIANQAAIAIDNARLYTDTLRLATQLRRSFRLAGEAIAASRDLERNLELMVQLAIDTVGANGGAIQFLDEGGRGPYPVVLAGEPARDSHFRALFPLVSEGYPQGALELWRSAPEFDEEEHDLLAAFAGHARTAIDHAQLYASLEAERERARLAEQIQADFSSMVSHELRTPLALIKGYVDTLLRPPVPLNADRSRRFIEGISGATDRLRRLIDNLLSASRLEAEFFAIDPHPVEVQALIQRAVSAAAFLARERQMVIHAPENELWVLGDADQLTQVLENLIGNAVKYAPGTSPVEITAQAIGNQARLTVRDQGPGIPPDALDLIFQKFYRIGQTRAQDGLGGTGGLGGDGPGPPGLGLGLYICRRLIEAHGGRIWAENGADGGSVFNVELPTRSSA